MRGQAFERDVHQLVVIGGAAQADVVALRLHKRQPFDLDEFGADLRFHRHVAGGAGP
ncbi:hypothetical protein D3C72_2527750 [compost metagenome]